MTVKSVSIRIEKEMLKKIGYIADYEGRSVNKSKNIPTNAIYEKNFYVYK